MKPLRKKPLSMLTTLLLLLSTLASPIYASNLNLDHLKPSLSNEVIEELIKQGSEETSAPKEKAKPMVMEFTLNKKTYTVNGTSTVMDVAPVTRNQRTLLPVIYVAGPLGSEIKWDAPTKKVTISLGKTLLELWIGNSTAKINGADTPIDPANKNVKPITLNGRTMLPLRFVAESLGCEVKWNAATQGITVTSLSGDKYGDKIDLSDVIDYDKIVRPDIDLGALNNSKAEPMVDLSVVSKEIFKPRVFTEALLAWDESRKTPTKTKTVDTLGEGDLEEQGVKPVIHLGKGYNIFGEFGSVNATKLPVLDFDKLLKHNWIQGKNLGSDIRHDTIIAESLKEYCKEMSNRTKVSATYMGFSGSAEVNFGETKEESKSRYHATLMYSRALNDFYIHPELMDVSIAAFLNPDAKKAINEGPIDKLFKNYGHYVLTGIKTGGRADINVSTESKSVHGKDDFSLKVKAGYNAIIGSVDAENEYKQSTAYKNFASKSEISFRGVGNDSSFNLDDFLEGTDKLTAWEKNIEEKPAMIGFSEANSEPLIPIWEFAESEQRRDEIKTEFLKIVGEMAEKIPGSSSQPKNYLYGIRLGRANEGMDVAIERADRDPDSIKNGTPKGKNTTNSWELLSTVEARDSKKDIADLNHGVEVGSRDHIVLDLAWNAPGNGLPITDICIYQGDDDTETEYIDFDHYGMTKWFLLGKDLNTNAGGKYLYLMWTRDTERAPIKNLALCIEDQNGGPNEKFPGWEVVHYAGSSNWADLNAGVTHTKGANEGQKAPNIYLVMRRGE